MKREKDFDWNFWAMIVVSVGLIAFLAGQVHAAGPLYASEVLGKTARTPARAPRAIQVIHATDRCLQRLDNRSVARVAIDVDGTVLDFPTKPTKVILGRKNSFGIEYVEADLAVSPLGPGARSHLYVYLEGRRFTFDLSTTTGGGCAVIAVRDAKDNQVSVDEFYPPKK